jgi:ribonuclease HI
MEIVHRLTTHTVPPTPPKIHETPPELLYSDPKIFVDAAWRKNPNGQSTKAGIGVHITWKHGQHTTDVFISAKTTPVSSPIQAEAEGLLIAANIASSLLLQDPYFFTDNLGLARGVQAHRGTDPNVLWKIRR